MRLFWRRIGAATAACLGLSTLLAPVQAGAAEATCRDLSIPVSLLDLPVLSLDQTMYGRLCTPAGGSNTVQVLIPGGTYNSSYWDIAQAPEAHSYRKVLNEAGFATLAVDRIGSGRSSKPLSVLLTAFTQANAVSHVVKAMKSGSLGPKFQKVIVGGHSLGSAISVVVGANPANDVDGVFIAGQVHRLNLTGILPTLPTLTSVLLDGNPRFSGLDPAFLTTTAGQRYTAFHRGGPLDEAAVAEDERTKDSLAPGEVVDGILLGTILPYSKKIKVPVLLAMGEKDQVFCDGLLGSDCSSAEALKQVEGGNFAPEAQLRTYVLPNYGHSFNYAPNAREFYEAVAQWSEQMVGR
ncbi:pimeloyl-ACP methyl ester carboxylesterase [Crossiella equi]|uniref:Pimeloyl-ACP methyl ester carboxylesterase n=1 Tax=Crossiella equi TaxID=130796 RepID=A0ABS5AGN0_9PSEU|nr:alpha/beta fold hydrolase [Crossiella equi]MBP2475739.1 pimeloyl-ACP methyl ester carboxylesterase [Crossiella equi]